MSVRVDWKYDRIDRTPAKVLFLTLRMLSLNTGVFTVNNFELPMSVVAIGPEVVNLVVPVLWARSVDDCHMPLAIPFPLLA
jgi:hypothetical protein